MLLNLKSQSPLNNSVHNVGVTKVQELIDPARTTKTS